MTRHTLSRSTLINVKFTEQSSLTLADGLQRIVGKTLLSVDFIEDYVQLQWQDAFITAYTSPKIIIKGIAYGVEGPEYRLSMCGLMGQKLSEVYVGLREEVRLQFRDLTILSISLRDEDYVGTEAMQFGGGDGPLWVI